MERREGRKEKKERRENLILSEEIMGSKLFYLYPFKIHRIHIASYAWAKLLILTCLSPLRTVLILKQG